MSSFAGKSVLVTAGAAGIGACIASAFAEKEANVHIVDIDEEALENARDANPKYLASAADVAVESEIDHVYQRHLDRFGDVYALVNCAGIAGPTAYVEEVRLADWHRCFGVNLDAAFLLSRKVIPGMKQRRDGRIINISSTAGWHGYPLRSPYSSAKWAVIGFTKSLAMELGQFGVTANTICPGSVDGERMGQVIAAEAREKGVAEEEIRRQYTRSCSMRTFISGDDIADMAVFLASPRASRVSGQIMNVDGHLETYVGLDDLDLEIPNNEGES